MLAALAKAELNGRHGYMHMVGKFIIRSEFNKARSFDSGLALVKLNGGFFISTKTASF